MKIIDSVFDFCPVCYKEHIINICEEEKQINYNGDIIHYTDTYYSCPDTPENSENGNIYYPGLLMDQNLQKIIDSYRINHNLFTAKEISALRNKFNLTPEEFSDLMLWENNRCADLENCLLQTEDENDKLLYVSNNVNFIKYYLKKYNDIKSAGTEFNKHYINQSITEPVSNVFDTAKYIINYFNQEAVTTMKLQKLCFYCYVWCLILNKNRLFKESIVAWDFGPVVKDLFYKHKGQYILTDIKGNTDNISNENKKIMDTVLKTYGILSPSQLVDKTHSEDPWKDTERNCVITDEKIISYYSDKEFSI